MNRILLPTVLALLAAGATAQDERAWTVPLQDRIPELANLSSWQQTSRYEGDHPDTRQRGVYPVGNGQAFGALGLGPRANTMQALTGPHYQTDAELAPEGRFGAITLDLQMRGEVVPLPDQRVARVLGAGFVVTEDRGPQLTLRTLTFAPPDGATLIRVIDVENHSGDALPEIEVHLQPDGALRHDGQTFLWERYESAQRPAVAYYAMSDAAVHGDALVAPLPPMPDGQHWTGVLTISMAPGATPPAEWAPRAPDLDDAVTAAGATLAWWQKELADTATLDTDHRKLRDLFADWKVMMLEQRDAESGVVVPMLGRRSASVREQIGPMLMLLRYGLHEQAKAILEFFFDATKRLGRVPESVPLDLAGVPPAPADVDWQHIDVPPGETASWLLLLHLWYWRASGDIDLIRRHWPLLEVCIKRQKRGADSLMTFGGDEPFMNGGLYGLYPDPIGADSGFIAQDVEHGRDADSFRQGVLFFLSALSIGTMVDGLDKDEHPDRWAKGKPDDSPGARWLTRSFEIRNDIEKRYWLEKEGLFAPALSPVTGQPDAVPFANGNLLPLWVGWTFPTGEKSRDNLTHTLEKLWRRGARIGTTPTVGYATGDVEGMLLTGLTERDGARRLEVLDTLLAMAEPAGEWASVIAPDGRPAAGSARCQPRVSGIDLDAIVYAINGVRYAAIAGWDDTDVRMKLRMPHGASYVTMKGIDKDARRLDVYFRDVEEPMTPPEIERNAGLPPDERLDPSKPQRVMHFRIEQQSENPPDGYWSLGLNALGTMHPRQLWKNHPVDEHVLWHEDDLKFLPPGDHEPATLPTMTLSEKEGASRLVLSARNAAADVFGGDDVLLVDTGLPIGIGAISQLLIQDGQRQHDTVFLDWRWNDPGTMTFTPAHVWDRLTPTLQRFEQLGGKVVQPGFLEHWALQEQNDWVPVFAENGRLALPGGGDTSTTARATFFADAAGDAVLRIGSGCGITVSLNGESVYGHDGARRPLPDADANVVKVKAGRNELRLELHPDGDKVVFARLTDNRGMPLEGVREGQ